MTARGKDEKVVIPERGEEEGGGIATTVLRTKRDQKHNS